MDAALFTKMLSDKNILDLRKLGYKFPQADIKEFTELLKNGFYHSLPLKDFSGQSIVYLSSIAQVRLSAAKVLLTPQNSTQLYGVKAMEEEIKEFTRANGEPYRLIPLPMADKVEWEGERLPATYANFLIMNGAVLVPFYDSPKDEIAKAALREAFPDREIIGINCLPLIKQHGSLHCVTMQYPEGFIE